MFKKVLVANRGEIACRILRTCERLGLATVAVFSDADVTAPHVALADEAFRLGGPAPRDSYLNLTALLAVLELSGADAVHPGYGFLSEQATFAAAVREAGATFVGPSEAALKLAGNKIEARRVAEAEGLRVLPGTPNPLDPGDAGALKSVAEQLGFPLLVKAAGGGGGIGMQVVETEAELASAVKTCALRASSAFGDARVYVERYLRRPRHIEVQILRDAHGQAVAFVERECSLQRRHQKLIEESPSPAGFFEGQSGELRRKQLTQQALRFAEAVGYEGAGTIEFIADASGELSFLEVNARLQVEHAVTECLTGLDLVGWQLRIAARERLNDAVLNAPATGQAPATGHAIEVRLYAEDPDKGFAPQPGRLTEVHFPDALVGIRIEAGILQGAEVTPFYDPLLAKIIAHGSTRAEARERLRAALQVTRLEIAGPKGPRRTNLEFLQKIVESEAFVLGDYDTGSIELLQRR